MKRLKNKGLREQIFPKQLCQKSLPQYCFSVPGGRVPLDTGLHSDPKTALQAEACQPSELVTPQHAAWPHPKPAIVCPGSRPPQILHWRGFVSTIMLFLTLREI